MCEERLIWTTTLQSHRLFMYITLKFPSRWQTKHIYCVDQNSRGKAKWTNNFSSKERERGSVSERGNHTGHLSSGTYFCSEVVWFSLNTCFTNVNCHWPRVFIVRTKTQMQSLFTSFLFAGFLCSQPEWA